jgi:SNF2 family DNA or RNA helicase
MFVNPTCFNKSFFAFRNTYFHLGRGNQVMASQGRVMTRGMMAQIFKQGFKYMITPQNREALLARMKPFTHWVKKEDALDLPEKIDEIRLVKLNPNEARCYKEMKNHLVAEVKGEVVTAEVALSKLMKLREITSGFLLTENHEAVRPGKSSKMRELEDTLEEIGQRQAIIWIQFKEEVRAISEMLAEKGISFSTLYSGTDDREVSIKDFQEGKSQVLVAHGLSAAHGLTFVNSNISIYFSLSYSWEQYAQSRDRQHRIGQKNKVTYIHILAENTIDMMIMDVLNKKKSLQDIIYELMKS